MDIGCKDILIRIEFLRRLDLGIKLGSWRAIDIGAQTSLVTTWLRRKFPLYEPSQDVITSLSFRDAYKVLLQNVFLSTVC